jgi:hypothetical protein
MGPEYRTLRCLLASLAFALLSACGASEVGEECDDAGDTDECEDGAICTNEDGGGAVCRALCKEQEDCSGGLSCNGVSGTDLKSCQPDKDR